MPISATGSTLAPSPPARPPPVPQIHRTPASPHLSRPPAPPHASLSCPSGARIRLPTLLQIRSYPAISNGPHPTPRPPNPPPPPRASRAPPPSQKSSREPWRFSPHHPRQHEDIIQRAAAALAGVPRLREMVLDECLGVTDLGLAKVVMGCPGMERLAVKSCREISDIGIDLLSKKCKDIRVLDIS